MSSEERVVGTRVTDAEFGTVQLSGIYGETPGASTLAIVIHGHAGNAGKPYCHRAALAARLCGFSSLRISMRGADLKGEDIYHGGLTGDIAAFAAEERFSRYRNIVLIGYSLGGHVAIRAALEEIVPRLRAIVAISPPLDIPGAVDALDSPERSLYRHYMLAGMRKIHGAAAARNRAPEPARLVRMATTFRRMDELTVVRRFGFRAVDHYYDEIDLKHRLSEVRPPVLVVASNHDPVIPPAVIRGAIRGASHSITTRWIDGGGHLYFPRNIDLGFGAAPAGLEPQIMNWARRQLA